ncbi:BrnT family toxin [Lysobacter capsici]|uniref:BrnT family toxin n=1 Tax=Lysobacter capsici TaxID=435897 RepID=UPI0012FE1312|nr:BrnT family toxin [Lysobacter capsici]
MSFIHDNLPEALTPFVNELPKIDLLQYRAQLELSKDRIEILQAVIRKEQEVDDLFALLDIHIYCLKEVFPEEYKAANVEPHDAANNHDITYDPAKNGKNLIKHGITFGEVRSFSPGFGTLIVPYPNERDEERLAIFSKLVVPQNSPLILPKASMKGGSDLSTMTLAIQAGNGFRFISSQTFHEAGWDKTMKGAVKSIFPRKSQSLEKAAFIKDCQDRVRPELFGANGDSGLHGPVRLFRATTPPTT